MGYDDHLGMLSGANAEAMLNADREWREESRREQAARAAAADDFAMKCTILAPKIGRLNAEIMQRAETQAQQADAEARRAAAERAAQLDDLRTELLTSGRGRWRTIGEILQDAAGTVT